MPSKEPSKKVKTLSKVKASPPIKKKAQIVPSKSVISSEFVADSDKDSESGETESESDDSLPEKSTTNAPVKTGKEAVKVPVKATKTTKETSEALKTAKEVSKAPVKATKEPVKASVKASVKINGSKTSQEKSAKIAPPVVEAESSSSADDSSDGSGSGSEDENEDEDEEESESEKDESTPESTAKPPQQQTPQTTSEPSKPLAKYQIPKGFEPFPVVPPSASASASRIASLFSKPHLANKKVFHFTTPASVPIGALERLKYKDIEAGKMSFSHNGDNYEVGDQEDAEGEDAKIMVMKDDSRNYNIAKHVKVSKTLHFRQTVPSALTAPSSRATIPKKRPARAQPEGLRIRFRSGEIGTAAASDSGEDSEEGSEEESE